VTTDQGEALRALQRARPLDPFLDWHVDAVGIEDLVTDGDHVAWTRLRRDRSERWATVLGDDAERAAALLRRLGGRAPLDGVTAHASAYATLPQEFRAPMTGHWSLWILEANRVTAAIRSWAAQASILEIDDPRIDALLRHSESAYVFTGASSIIRWAGVEKGDRLVAVAGQEVEASGAAHLVSVCSDPGHRGMGYARAVCSRLVVEAVSDGSPVVILEMYAANAAGRALYSAIGFTEAHRYQSGLLSPRTSVAVNAP
jgi:ribosomal protein S18 acetylase RimI-like enzyme